MENKITYVCDSGDGESRMYDIGVVHDETNNQKISMSYSQIDGGWTSLVRGKVAVKLKDNGDGVKIKFDNGRKIKLDYDQIETLSMLLMYYNEDAGFSNFVSKMKKI